MFCQCQQGTSSATATRYASALSCICGGALPREGDRSFFKWVDDATTTAAVKTRLVGNDNTKGLQIDVDTSSDVVTLSGRVASAQETQLAEEIAATPAMSEMSATNLSSIRLRASKGSAGSTCPSGFPGAGFQIKKGDPPRCAVQSTHLVSVTVTVRCS